MSRASLIVLLLLGLSGQAIAQDHPTDDYFHMRSETDRQRAEAERYRDQRDEMARERLREMDKRYDFQAGPFPTRVPCVIAGVATECDK